MKKVLGWLVAAVLVLGAFDILQDEDKARELGRTTGNVLDRGGEAVGNAGVAGAIAVDEATK